MFCESWTLPLMADVETNELKALSSFLNNVEAASPSRTAPSNFLKSVLPGARERTLSWSEKSGNSSNMTMCSTARPEYSPEYRERSGRADLGPADDASSEGSADTSTESDDEVPASRESFTERLVDNWFEDLPKKLNMSSGKADRQSRIFSSPSSWS